jgi:hypothetical protein
MDSVSEIGGYMRTTNRYFARYGVLATFLAFLIGPAVNPSVAQSLPPGGGIAPPARTERPYRGLFGGGVGNTAQSLTLEGSLGGGFVQNPLAEQGSAAAVGDPSNGGGASGVGSVTLSYEMSRTRFGAHGSYNSLVDYYPQLEENSMMDRHVVTGTVYFMPGPSTRIALIENFKNFPELSLSDLFDPELEQGVPIQHDFALTLDRYRRFGTGVEIGHGFSKRTRIDLDMNYGHGMVANREWVILTGSVNLTHNISKGISLFAGYQEGGQRDAAPGAAKTNQRQPRIKAGVDMNKSLSFSRRTKVSFSTGVAGTEERELQQTTYHVVGSARIDREFGQTWVAGLSYNRNLRHIESLGQPLLTDSGTLGIQGSFSKRIQFQSRIGTSAGRVGSSGSLDNQFGLIQVSAAMTRRFALGMDYSYSRLVAKTDGLPLDALGERKGQSVRTYVQVWVPLLIRTKKS